MNYQEQYQEWLTNPYFDEETKQELKAIADNENEIKERFYKDLEFGTAGAARCDRCRNKPFEYLYSEKSNTGTCELYFAKRTSGKRCGNRI